MYIEDQRLLRESMYVPVYMCVFKFCKAVQVCIIPNITTYMFIREIIHHYLGWLNRFVVV